jgi:hypothetical protein
MKAVQPKTGIATMIKPEDGEKCFFEKAQERKRNPK